MIAFIIINGLSLHNCALYACARTKLDLLGVTNIGVYSYGVVRTIPAYSEI